MPSINSDQKWEVSGRGEGVAYMPSPTRSLPSSPPRTKQLEMSLSLSEMLGDCHRDEIRGDLVMTSSVPSGPPPCFRTMEESIEMTNDLLDLTKPLPWDRLKHGASTMSLDSLNENYLEAVPGEMAVLEDQDKTPVATCTCGNTTNFECWVHRVPFGGAGELTEEISQTCLRLVRELRSEPLGCDGISTDPSSKYDHDFTGFDYGMKGSPLTNHARDSIDTPCSWTRDIYSDLNRDRDTPSSKSSGSLASALSVQKSELSTSPDSYDLLYKSFEVAVEMDRLMLERGQSEGSSVGSSLESLNRTSPKLQKVLSQKRRSSPDGSVESPADAGFSCGSGSLNRYRAHSGQQYTSKSQTMEVHPYEAVQQEDAHPRKDAAQKVTFASLAKRKKKPDAMALQAFPDEVTHWTELVSGLLREEVDTVPHAVPVDASRRGVGNRPNRPHSLPIQLRHIQKPSSRPQQTPEQSQGGLGGAGMGVKGVTRTLSAPEGFGSSFARSSDLSSSKITTWALPAASQSTHCISLLTRKRHYNSQGLPTPQWDSMLDSEGRRDPKMAAGSPLINSGMHDAGPGPADFSFPRGGYSSDAGMPAQVGKVRVLAMDINANFTEPQELDTFIPEHHDFIPQESTGAPAGVLRGESPAARLARAGMPLGDRLHFRADIGVESSSDWIPGQRSSTWLDVTHRRTAQPPRTLDLKREKTGPLWEGHEEEEEVRTCSRGCSTDSPPAVDSTSFLRAHLRIAEVEETQPKEQLKECRDIGVSTDQAQCGLLWKEEDLCPCTKNGCHGPDAAPSVKTPESDKESQSNTAKNSPCDSEEQKEQKNDSMKITPNSSSDPRGDTERHGRGQHQVLTIPPQEESGKMSASTQELKTANRKAPKVKATKDPLPEECLETSVQSWHIGKGRRGSRTIVTCQESRIADALQNRVVKIQNVGASMLPLSSDKKYIRHLPLKPIRQVDAEHRQRKVLQKLYSNDKQLATPLPPTVNAWPGPAYSMHPRAARVHSLPADLRQHPSQSQAGQSQAGQSQPPLTRSEPSSRPIRRILSWESGDRRGSRQQPTASDLTPAASDPTPKQHPLSLNVASQYDTGSDCLPPQEMQVSPREAKDEVNLLHKKALVTSIEGGVEHILSHFAQSRTKSLQEKGRLGSTAHSPDIGHLMLHYLCPAVRALLLDGLRPHVTSFFVGHLKTTLWDIVEATTQLGPGTRPLHELVRHLSQQTYLKSSELRVNAFIMGLLNIRCLELWLEHIRDHPDIVRSLYEPTAFLSLCNGATRALFDRLLVAVQPLMLLPFDLDYKFEYRGVVHRQNQREQQHLMEQHAQKTGGGMTKSNSPLGGSWLKETASLLWKKTGEGAPRTKEPSGTLTSSSQGFLQTLKGQRPTQKTKNSQSSEQPVAGQLKTDENTSPAPGVASTRDSAPNKETANSWSLDWIKGFVAASAEATTSDRGVSGSSRAMTSSGSSWSRIGSSLSKAFDRIKPDAAASVAQPRPHRQQSSPNRTPERDAPISTQPDTPPKAGSSLSQSPVSPGSPVKARCHHVTMSHDELSFTKGSILTVEQQVDPDWLMCSQGNQSGLVHIDYVQGMD